LPQTDSNVMPRQLPQSPFFGSGITA